jgi:cell division protein ZapA
MVNKGVNITIMGKDLSVACPPQEQEDLLAAARFLDKNMKEIQKTGKVIGAERCAIMAALNITNDFLKLQRDTKGQDHVQQRLEALQSKIDDVLEEAKNY